MDSDENNSAGTSSQTSGLLCVLQPALALSGLQIPTCQMRECGRTISKDWNPPSGMTELLFFPKEGQIYPGL